MFLSKNKKGFTLIELLVVVAIIGIIASIIIVVIDPLLRFRVSRDAARWQDVSAIMTAIKLDQIDNGGDYATTIENMAVDEWYMIVQGDMDVGCASNNYYCDQNVSADINCVDLTSLVDQGYLALVPISPAGKVEWDDGEYDNLEGTGYVLYRSSDGYVRVQACESEKSTSSDYEIFVAG